MMISTWDGDEFSFNTDYHSFKNVVNNLDDFKKTTKLFHQKLVNNLSRYEIDTINIENGLGFFKGSIPLPMSKMFVYNKDRYIVCPTYDSMKEYINS
jgi:hypothetical protein